MIAFFMLVLVVSLFEWMYMKKNDLNRERWLYLVMTGLTLAFGYYYFSDPYRNNLSHIILELLGIQH